MNVNVNLHDGSLGVGNSTPSPGFFQVQLPDGIQLTKTTYEKQNIQKKNEQDELLFKKITGVETVVDEFGNETEVETFEEVPFGSEQFYEVKQDEQGNDLYLNKDGNEITEATTKEIRYAEKSYEIVYETKTRINPETNEEETYQEPKVDENDNIIYQHPVYVLDENNSYIIDHYEETIEQGTYEMPYEFVENNTLIVLRDETVEYEPIMIEEDIPRTVSFEGNMDKFNVDDIIYEKFKNIMETLGFQYCYADEFIEDSDIDLGYINHGAHTGTKILIILPYKECKLKTITLEVPTTDLLLYLDVDDGIVTKASIDGQNYISFVDNKVHFENYIQEVTLLFENITNINKSLGSYAILYNSI